MRRKKEGIFLFEFLAFLFLIIFTGFFTFSGLKIFKEKLKLKNDVSKIKSELEKEISRNEELKKNLEKFEGESFWEEKARERGYKKAGEKEIMIFPQQ